MIFTVRVRNNVRMSVDLCEENLAIDLTKPGGIGSTTGLAENSLFGHARCLAVEFDQNVFVTDSRSGSVKILTTVSGTSKFLEHLNLLLQAGSLHLKNETYTKTSLSTAISQIKSAYISHRK